MNDNEAKVVDVEEYETVEIEDLMEEEEMEMKKSKMDFARRHAKKIAVAAGIIVVGAAGIVIGKKLHSNRVPFETAVNTLGDVAETVCDSSIEVTEF